MDEVSNDMDLAPQHVRRSLNSLFSGTQALLAVQPRERDIMWEDHMKDTKLTVLEVCGNKIIAGLDDGQVNIYNIVDLNCEKSLPCYQQTVSVQCLQCTCTEIIAGYNDGNVCTWNIQSGLLTRKISLRTLESKDLNANRYPTCMQWEEPKLVVGASDGRIVIFQHVNSNLTALGVWRVSDFVKQVYFDAKYVIIYGQRLRVYNWNGRLVREISILKKNLARPLFPTAYEVRDMTYLDGNVVAIGVAGRDPVTQVINVKTGKIVNELEGHVNGPVLSVDAYSNCVLSGDSTGGMTLWSLEAARNPDLQAVVRFASPEYSPNFQGANPNVRVCWVRLGQNFFVTHFSSSSKIVVTDFP